MWVGLVQSHEDLTGRKGWQERILSLPESLFTGGSAFTWVQTQTETLAFLSLLLISLLTGAVPSGLSLLTESLGLVTVHIWAQMVKNLPAKLETWVDPWVGKIPWRGE